MALLPWGSLGRGTSRRGLAMPVLPCVATEVASFFDDVVIEATDWKGAIWTLAGLATDTAGKGQHLLYA